MKKYLIYSILLASCGGFSAEEFFETCPHELRYGASHYLEVPVSIIPQQEVYNVGDTLTIRMLFSDSIMDLSRQVRFKIENFPFQPYGLLYKVNTEEWEQGFRLNDLHIDEERYNTRYNPQSSFSDDIVGHSVYEDGFYHFEYFIVLRTPGRYVTVMSDVYDDNLRTSQSFLNEEANSVQFEGRCSAANFLIATVINGDSHVENYINEIQLLDEQVYRGNLTSINEENRNYIGGGSNPIEWIGMYGFEVVE